MNYKTKVRWLIGTAIVSFILSIALYYVGPQFDDIGFVLEIFSPLSFVFLIILYFLPEQVFTTWFKFARIYIPIALVLAVGGGATSNGSDLFNTDAEFFTTFFSVIFVITSIILIISKTVKLRRSRQAVASPQSK